MLLFVVLVLASLAFMILPRRLGGRSIKDAARRGMAVAFIFAGFSHLAMPASFEDYFPSWVPFVTPLIYLTGIAEIAGGIALLIRRFQATAGVALAIYLVLVFPANIYVAVAGVEEALPGLPEADWYGWARLPFQLVYIWWVLRSTQPSDAPAQLLPSRKRLRLAS
jgi:uncharacterized membrane protein